MGAAAFVFPVRLGDHKVFHFPPRTAKRIAKKLTINDFEVSTIIGKGAFGEVCFNCR